jgi:uncharacterized membrane protein
MPKSIRNGENYKEEKVQSFISEFSNGVFAFAITLLVLDIRLPSDVSKANLGTVLASIWPNYLGFLISFLVIGMLWIAYIRLLKEIVRTDHRFLMLNLLYLLFIVLVPFSTNLISLYLSKLSVIIYAALMACAGYMYTVLRIYSSLHHRLIDKHYSTQSIRSGILLSLIIPVVFTLSIGVALINAFAAQMSWVLGTIAYSVVLHRFRDRFFM